MPFIVLGPNGLPIESETQDYNTQKSSIAHRGTYKCLVCGGDMGLKKSSKGRLFHAHYSLQNCSDGEGKSLEHEYLQVGILHLAKENGFHADMEKYVKIPNDTWRFVDVAVMNLDLTSDNSLKNVAFEIQLSPQIEDVYQKRSDTYTRNGYLPVWITRKKNLSVTSARIVIDTADELKELINVSRKEIGDTWNSHPDEILKYIPISIRTPNWEDESFFIHTYKETTLWDFVSMCVNSKITYIQSWSRFSPEYGMRCDTEGAWVSEEDILKSKESQLEFKEEFDAYANLATRIQEEYQHLNAEYNPDTCEIVVKDRFNIPQLVIAGYRGIPSVDAPYVFLKLKTKSIVKDLEIYQKWVDNAKEFFNNTFECFYISLSKPQWNGKEPQVIAGQMTLKNFLDNLVDDKIEYRKEKWYRQHHLAKLPNFVRYTNVGIETVEKPCWFTKQDNNSSDKYLSRIELEQRRIAAKTEVVNQTHNLYLQLTQSIKKLTNEVVKTPDESETTLPKEELDKLRSNFYLRNINSFYVDDTLVENGKHVISTGEFVETAIFATQLETCFGKRLNVDNVKRYALRILELKFPQGFILASNLDTHGIVTEMIQLGIDWKEDTEELYVSLWTENAIPKTNKYDKD